MVVIKPRILCFVACYLPGYRGGGPVRTIASIVEHLGDEFDISIVTRDRDISDTSPYSGVAIDNWNRVGKAKVFYASKKMRNCRGTTKLLRETPHDVLYLNSFFDVRFTILPLVARRFGSAPNAPCLIAPRGEFSKAAIALKALKKRLHIKVAKAFGLYHGLFWQASSDYEQKDIVREFGLASGQVQVAPNLTPIFNQEVRPGFGRVAGPLRLVFLSRISPMKNLDYLLRVLSKVKTSLQVTIHGPVEDAEYWAQCQSLIQALPLHISVTYAGEVTPAEVSQAFAGHDLFVFPTRGENFGHVIFESLAAGTSVIVSDQAPWRPDPAGAVEVLSLGKPEAWVDAIERRAGFYDADRVKQRSVAVTYSRRYAESSQAVELNRRMFQAVLGKVEKQD